MLATNSLPVGLIRAAFNLNREAYMGMGRGLLFWLLGIPLPIIIILALFWHH
jgi:hypothetical protein